MSNKGTQSTESHPSKITPIPLMQIISGFWVSKTLAASVELDLFSKLSGRSVDVIELTQILGLHPRPAEMLLSGCTALGHPIHILSLPMRD
ncbi:MAG: methyltransferase family protein [Thermodesulfobacteriota bacterium]